MISSSLRKIILQNSKLIKNFNRKMSEKKFKVLVTHWEVPDEGINLLKLKTDVTICSGIPNPTREEILEKIKGVDGLFWVTHDKLNAEVLDAAGPQLKSISTMSSGIDYVDVQEIKKRGIALGHTPTILNDAVADVAIGLMISAGRRFHEGRRKIETNTWEIRPQILLGCDIKGSTVGIVGFGGIGQTIAERLQGFKIGQILYCGHNPKPEADKLKAKFVSFDDLLHKSDYIFVSAPLTDETRGMFNQSAFEKMKSTSVFVNVARGPLVDQDALYNALKSKKIFAAGLDVMTPEPLPADDKLLELENCVVIPHLGSDTYRTTSDMSVVAAYNVLRGLAGEPLLAPVQ